MRDSGANRRTAQTPFTISLVHHSDRGSQYMSIRYSERLAEAGIEPSVGSKGDSYDNALAETINGLYKAELIHRRAPWKTKESLELATLDGCPGSIITGCCNPSATSHRPKPKQTTIVNSPSRPCRPDSRQRASTNPGAVQGRLVELLQVVLREHPVGQIDGLQIAVLKDRFIATLECIAHH